MSWRNHTHGYLYLYCSVFRLMSQGRLRFIDKNMNYMFEIKGLFSSGDRKQVFYYEKKANVNVSLFFNFRIFER